MGRERQTSSHHTHILFASPVLGSTWETCVYADSTLYYKLNTSCQPEAAWGQTTVQKTLSPLVDMSDSCTALCWAKDWSCQNRKDVRGSGWYAYVLHTSARIPQLRHMVYLSLSFLIHMTEIHCLLCLLSIGFNNNEIMRDYRNIRNSREFYHESIKGGFS